MEKAQAGKLQPKGFKKKIGRVFQRSRSTGEQEEDAQSECKDSQAASHKKRSWGSWRRKKARTPTSPLPAGGDGRDLASANTVTSIHTNDCNEGEQATRDSEEVHNNEQVVDTIQSTKLEPKSPKSPTGKSSKFQNNRFPSSGKAEEGKRSQVLDYLGGIFTSSRKKSVKASSAVPLSPGNSVEESTPATKDLSSPGQSSSNIQGSGSSKDHGSEGLTEADVLDRNLAEICSASPDESCPVAVSSDPGERSASLSENKKFTVIGRVSDRDPRPKGLEKQFCIEVVRSNRTEVGSDVLNVLVNKGEPSFTSGSGDASLQRIDRTVKECEAAKLSDTSQHTQPKNDSKFVNSDRLTEGQCDCEGDEKCIDLPAIKEYALPISEIVRIERVAGVAEITISPRRAKVDSGIKLSKASVLLPINSIGVEFKGLEKPLKEEEDKQLNHSTLPEFKKDIKNHSISEKTKFTPDVAKQQLLKVESHAADNPSGEESNTDKPISNSHTNAKSFKSTVERSSSLELDFGLTLVNSFEMDKKSPPDGKPGGKKGKRRRSVKSNQSGRNAVNAEADAIEESFNQDDSEINEVNLTQQSPKVPGKMLQSPTQGTPPLVRRKTLPESVLSAERSAEAISKPVVSRKKSSQRTSFSPSPDNEAKSPKIGSLEKTSSGDAQQNVGNSNIHHSVLTEESHADMERLKTQKMNNAKGKSNPQNVITSQLHSTVTTRIRLPSNEKEGESDAQIKPSQLKSCAEIRTEEEETIRVTLPKRKNATSHHKVDFCTVKNLPLASASNKTCVGSLTIQLQNKSARRTDGTLTVIGKRQPSASRNAEAAAGVKADAGPQADEIAKANADGAQHISDRVHRTEGEKTAGVHVETDRSEERGSVETGFSGLCGYSDVKSQSPSVDMQTSEISLSEVEKGVSSQSFKKHQDQVDTGKSPPDPAVEAPTALLSDENKDASHDLNQGKRSSNVVVRTVVLAQRRLPSTGDAALLQASESIMPELEEKDHAKAADEGPTGAGKLAQERTPVLRASDCKAQNSVPQPKDTSGKAESESKTDTNASHATEQQGRLGTSAAIKLSTLQTQAKETKKMDALASDGALPLQVEPVDSEHKEKETGLVSSFCEQVSKINTDISAGIITDSKPGSTEAETGPDFPSQQNVSLLHCHGSELKKKASLQTVQALKPTEVVVDKASARSSNEQNDNFETKNGSLEPPQTIKSSVSEAEKCATRNSVTELQESWATAATDDAMPVKLNSLQVEPGKSEAKDSSPQSVEIPKTQNEAQTSLPGDAAPALQMNDTTHVCDQAPNIKTDTVASAVGGIVSGPSEVTLGPALPSQQIAPTIQSDDSEISKAESLQSTPAFETTKAETSNEEPVEFSKGQVNDCKTNAPPESRQISENTVSEMGNGRNPGTVLGQQESRLPAVLASPQTVQRENEKTKTSPQSVEVSDMLTSADSNLAINQGMANLPLRESEANDASVRLQTSTTEPSIGKDVPANGVGDTETKLVQPLEQDLSILENGGIDKNSTASSQSVQPPGTAESDQNEASSPRTALEQNGGSEVTPNKLGLPLLSSTPKVHREVESKSANPALNWETPARNLCGEKDAFATDALGERTEVGASTNAQSIEVSQPSKASVKESSVVIDTCTDKVNVDLESTTNGTTTASISQQESEITVSFNEGSSLDSSSDMDSFTETIRRYGNPIQLQKRQRVPKVPLTPPFAMPPIQEDQPSPKKEKKFDPSTFKFGLMRKSIRQSEAPSSLLKMQQIETKSKVVKRVSAEQSLLFKTLANKKPLFKKDDRVQDDLASASDSKRSRLEMGKTLGQTSSLLTGPATSADTSPSLQKNYTDKELECDLSNTTSSEIPSPANTEKCLKSNTSENESNSLSVSEKYSESGSTIPNLKPNLLEIDTNFGASVNTSESFNELTFQGLDFLHRDRNPLSLFGTDLFTPKCDFPNQPDTEIPEMENVRLNSRPGKIVIYSEPRLNGEASEYFHDVQDATSLKLSSEISIRVVRGCWLLYEKPNFEGSRVALEEGVVELTDIWRKEENEGNASICNESVIGSIRRVTKEWCLPEINLCTELNGLGRRTTHFDEMEEIQTYGILEPTLSLEVISSTWLLFEEPFYQGNSYIVEPGQYPCPESWEATDPYIGSLRPLKMGALKVENLHEHKVIIYEKPLFEGKQLEIKTDVFSFTEDDESALCHTYPFANIGSMKVLGGFWVGYEKPGFQGHQYALEEGQYKAWTEWGGYNRHLQSLRFIHVDLSNPAMIMYSDTNFSEKCGSIEVVGPVPILEETDYGLRTMSINVLSGTWVAYENSDFTGEQYILEKGLYSTFEDWGARNSTIASVQPVVVDAVDSELSKFKVKFFSEPEFQGSVQIFDMDAVQFPDGFSPKSCEVLSGSWVVFDAEDFTGRQYVLEEGTYPDLAAMGCLVDTCIKSAQTVNFCFSMPGIILFMREKFEGKRVELISEVLNLKLGGYNTRVSSVKVNGGMWVVYEGSNYRGQQVLLQPSQIPNWHQHTGWHVIGSLRPLIQRRVYFRVRNRGTGAFLTLTGELTDMKMIRIQALEESGTDDQIWFYQEGYIKNKIGEDCCLDVAGSLLGIGSRLGISLLHSKDIHIWSIDSDGVIWNCIRTDLVIDIKGGQHYDKNQTILSTFDEVRPTQRWDLDIV
ncbi:very large A-kinase anchor protein [Hypanus sabinus]|uniref:very large A-kinase anchor protein n=1 Tax=Hypanus sabinus TaxID=79690 RepID=UPI0028C3D5FB|nr:very large A-kinase anchor protein [Hypanus sabinus]